MTTPHAVAPPRVLPAHITHLREDLREAGYTIDRFEEILGADAAKALRRDDPAPARRILAGRSDACSVLLSLFSLGTHLSRELVVAAFPRLGLPGALELGLLDESEGTAWALVDLSPYAATDDLGEIHWWIASDLSELATGEPLGPDHVLGVGGASQTLARITPRTRVDRALDLGCGSGIQALHASRHAAQVVATDLSPRAVAFAAFTAALNEVEIDLRVGSLLDPVAEETFDLIVSNPPFVITPRTVDEDGSSSSTWTYRDGGQAGDTLLAMLLEALPARLRPGGTAVLLGNWEVTPEGPWEEHPRAWCTPAQQQGVHSWVIQRETEDPAEYAATWARDGGITPRDAAWDPMIGAWLDDFEVRRVTAVGFGYLLLRRPSRPVDGSVGEILLEEVLGMGSGSLGEHMGASLDTLERLAGLTDAELLASRPVRADDVVERRHLTPGAWDPMLIEIVQGAGLGRAVAASQVLAGTVGACDGSLTLEQILSAVSALTDGDLEEIVAAEMPALRGLIRKGMLHL